MGVGYQNASETELHFLGQSRVRVIIVGGWLSFRNDVSLFLFVLGQFCAGDIVAVFAELVFVKFLIYLGLRENVVICVGHHLLITFLKMNPLSYDSFARENQTEN